MHVPKSNPRVKAHGERVCWWKWWRMIYLHCTGGWEAKAAAIKESWPREWVSEPSIFFWLSPFWHLPASWENALLKSALRGARSFFTKFSSLPFSLFMNYNWSADVLVRANEFPFSCVSRVARLLRKVCMDESATFLFGSCLSAPVVLLVHPGVIADPLIPLSGRIDEKVTYGSFVSPPVNASISDSPCFLFFLSFLHCKMAPVAHKHAWAVLLMNLLVLVRYKSVS